MEIRFQNGSTDTVRLIGVDTPEVHTETDPQEWEGVSDSSAGRDCLSEEGHDSSEFAKQKLSGETVQLVLDEAADSQGYYGRLLAYIEISGMNFNYQLVADGYARVYASTFSQSDRFYEAENAAQTAKTGAWRCRSVVTATTTDTAGGGDLAITRIHEDAAGNDHENLNDEYIVFKNTGGGTLDISGWTVEDEADHTYVVPSGVAVGSGATITLYTGSGTDTKTELYWGSGRAIWNNGGDTIFVYDDSGTLQLDWSY